MTPTTKPKDVRNRLIYREYLDLVKSNPRKRFTAHLCYYSELADKWFLSEATIGKIIRKQIKNEYTRTA